MFSSTVYIFSQIIIYLLIIRALMSWVVRDYSHPFVKVIVQLTEPILMPVRQLFAQTGLGNSGFDFSFLITFIIVEVLSNWLVQVLAHAGL